MQLKIIKCFRLMLSILCFGALTCVMAQASSKHYSPAPIKGFSGPMSHVYLQDSVDVWIPDLFELNTSQVLDKVSGNRATTVPLLNHRLHYVDGIVNDQSQSRIELHYVATSNRTYITTEDLYPLAVKFRVLRDDFFNSIKVPGLMRTYKAISTTKGDKVVIKKDGSVETAENTDSSMYGENDILLNYFSSDWTKVLQEGTYTELDGGKQKVVGRANDAEVTIVLNTDGTFSDVTSQGRTPGGWTLKTICHFDEWTTGSTILLPGKMDWSTSMVTNDLEVTLVDSHIRLLNLEGKYFIKPR